MTQAPTRRELGSLAAAAVGWVALHPAAALAAGSASAAAQLTLPVRLQRLIGVEQLMLYCYEQVLGLSLLGPRERRAIAPLPAHEHTHIDALELQLAAYGATAPRPPESVAEADRRLAHRKVPGRLGQLKGAHDAIRLLLSLERVTVGAYFVALTKVESQPLIVLIAQIMAADAQHEAILGLQLPPYKPAAAVPYGLVQGVQ
ncbi:MAG: ferritin-like domain-containing protein [Solirubrobacteraceae bacterium]